MESEYPGAEYGFGLGLDYTKAFDSTNASLAAALFARIGVQFRWECFARVLRRGSFAPSG